MSWKSEMPYHDYRIGAKISVQEMMKQRLLLGKVPPPVIGPTEVAAQAPTCCEAHLWKGRSEGLLASQQMLLHQMPHSAPIYINNEAKGLMNNSMTTRPPTTPTQPEMRLTWRARIFGLFRSSPATFLAASSLFLILTTCVCSHYIRLHKLRARRRPRKTAWRRRNFARQDPYQSLLANLIMPQLD